MTHTQPSGRTPKTGAFLYLLASALLLVLTASASIRAQSTGIKPPNAAAGAPAGSYGLSGFENVNLFSGNLNFHLPLIGVGGRGGAGTPAMLTIDSVRWRLKRGKSNTNSGDDIGRRISIGAIDFRVTDLSDITLSTESGNTVNVFSISRAYTTGEVWDGTALTGQIDPQPVYFWVDPDGFQGAVTGYGPGVLQARTVSMGGRLSDQGDVHNTPGNALTTVVFTATDGTEYALYDKDTLGQPFHYTTSTQVQPHARGTVFVSTDGNAATFVSDSTVNEYFSYSTQMQVDYPSALSGYLMLANGTRYRIVGGKVMWVRDRNGNVTTYDYANGAVTKITDSIGRTVNFLYHVQVPAGTPCPYNTDTTNDGTKCWYDEISTKGAGGAARALRVWHAKLDRALRHDYASTGTYASLFPSYEQEPGADEPYDPADVKTAVELPDGRSYIFRYNPHNELARVVLPTGGATEYDYDTLMSAVNLQRAVRERRVYVNAGDTTPQSVQKYTRSLDGVGSSATAVTVTQQDGAGGAPLTAEKHYFYGNVLSGHLGFYSSWREGTEYKTETMASDGQTPLRRVETELEARAYLGWYNSGQPQTTGPALDPRLRQTVTTLTDTTPNLSTKQLFYYDSDPALTYNLQTKVEEYGFDSELLRSAETEYLKSAAYAEAPVYLRGLPLRKSVYDAGHVEMARTTFEYDDYTHDPGTNNRHAALVSYSDISGLCLALDAAGNCTEAADASYTARGNVTGATSYLLDNVGNVTGSVTTNQQYDIAGNVVKAVDSRVKPDGGGYETGFDFSDNFGVPNTSAQDGGSPVSLAGKHTFAFVTAATNALGQSFHSKYDYDTGQAVDFEDANGTVMKLTYGVNDPLDRLSQVERAVGDQDLHSQTTYSYNDVGRKVTTTSDLSAYGDNMLKGEAFYDGLGRTTEARQYETATQYVSTLTKYDALGRASAVSNPYRPQAQPASTPVWTTSTYDALGRVHSVTTPDGATVYTLYDGTRMMVTDQAGKQRVSKADALGRLTDVWEVRSTDTSTGTESVSFPVPQELTSAVPPVSAGYRTSYTYDVLGNLRKVEQGVQHRYFAYDSLGRLLRASSPEQEANSALALGAGMVSPQSDGNDSWSLSYEYDEAGNLKKRTDARGVETSYAYDALGRVTERSYTDVQLPQGGTISTPTVKYYYDSQTLPGAPTTYTPGKSVGQLIAVTYGGASSATGSYLGEYDALGRAKYSAQVTAGPTAGGQTVPVTYEMKYDYDRAGNLISEKYPSGRIVRTEYDDAGRVAGVKNHVTGLYYVGGDPGVANNPNVIAYTAGGDVAALRLGNGLWEHTFYNDRLQLKEIGLGTSSADSSKLKLEYAYAPTVDPTADAIDGTKDQTKNNGNVRSQRISVPAEGNTPAQTFTQVYTYDALNRLDTAWEVNGGAETWRQAYLYDRFGNRRLDEEHTTKLNTAEATVYAVDSLNRATMNPAISPSTNRISEAGYSFDASGNLLCDSQHPCVPSPSLTSYFEYDAENHMVKTGGGAQAGGSEYAYDDDGRRVRKTSGSEITVFVYDVAGKLVAEYGNAQPQTVGVSYLTLDTLGSLRAVTGQNGGVKSRHDYQPFGDEIDSLKVPNSGRGNFTSYNYGTVRQKFTGYDHNGETNLEFAGARYYSGTQGRFISPDPYMGSAHLINPQSFNRYTYCLNNPLSIIDPSGLDPIWVHDINKKLYFSVAEDVYNTQYKDVSGYEQVTNIGPEGFTFTLSSLHGDYQNDQEYQALLGSKVYLGEDGRFHAENNGYEGEPGISDYIKIFFLMGTLRTPARGGPPHGHSKFPDGNGGGTVRYFDGNGDAERDYDFGHNHGAGDPHVHEWDWTKKPPRQPGRPLRPGEIPAPGVLKGPNGVPIWFGDRYDDPIFMPVDPAVPGMPAPSQAPIRVPFRWALPVTY
jgi:RHS repeat-associated protein